MIEKIEEREVHRDEQGYWRHPDYPEWSESDSGESINDWFYNNGITFHVVHFEDSISPVEVEAFLLGDSGVVDWKPACAKPGAFLLAIQSTLGLPVAIYAVPLINNED